MAGAQAIIDVSRGEFKVDENQAVAREKKSTPLPVLFIFGAMALLTPKDFTSPRWRGRRYRISLIGCFWVFRLLLLF